MTSNERPVLEGEIQRPGTTQRRVHLGIDYGTSSSKLVFRDYSAPGGERATLIETPNGYLSPSTVWCTSNQMAFGAPPANEPSTAFESVKMRVADEVKHDPGRYYFGPTRTLPENYSAVDLATLSVWWLISQGELAIRRILRNVDTRLGMTLGIPMSFFSDSELRDTFLMIARSAWHLFREHGPLLSNVITFENGRAWLERAYAEIRARGPVPADEVRGWIRSEAEAAMLWAFRSPATPAGPYFKIDVGAGTTNASMFRIVHAVEGGQWVPKGFAFFGACSLPFGMDALDRHLAASLGMEEGRSLELRTQEDRLLRDTKAREDATKAFLEIRSTLVQAWKLGYPKIMSNPREVEWWREADVFVIGGGSLVTPLANFLAKHPSDASITIPLRRLETPLDLTLENGSGISAEMLPFVIVAYGLSNLALAIPEAETPENIPPITPMTPRQRLTHEEIYGD